jgi:uncharacterized membrane protein
MSTELALSTDLGTVSLVAVIAVASLSVSLLALEAYRARDHRRAALSSLLTGALGTLAVVVAILRPAMVESDDLAIGPRVLVLVDASRSMDLPGDGAERRSSLAAAAATAIVAEAGDARVELATFGRGAPSSATPEQLGDRLRLSAEPQSDLSAALDGLARRSEEPPAAVVVVSDGRLDRPGLEELGERGALGLGPAEIPIHTVSVAKDAPKDAAIRSVRAAGAAVAHQPFSVRVEVACSGGLACGTVSVVARELEDKGAPEVLARGKAELGGGADASGTVELVLTLHRAGARVVEFAIEAPEGDTVPDNDRRFAVLDVSRDRVRILHIAGRPTYDVRAMRTWLKADGSVDVVAFFILRTLSDHVGAPPSELALIPFPVDELFTVHLPSFDAVVLQDFDAEAYSLTPHLGALARYVDAGGGLIMVGGPTSFGSGKYAGSELAEVLPVALGPEHEREGADLGWFVPDFTSPAQVAPVLAPLRAVVGERLPSMPGTNLVGAARPGATVLFTHPSLRTGDQPMPVLALGEHGTGRTIALTIDGTHRLAFGTEAAEHAGRGYGALWDGLLGWLMRDPKYESTTIELPAGCIAGQASELVLRPLPGTKGAARVVVTRLGGDAEVVHEARVPIDTSSRGTSLGLPPLEAGGYAVSVRTGEDDALGPATRRDFACERGGSEWADVRPDPARLAAIARLGGGVAVSHDDVASIPRPKAMVVSTQRRARPIAPPWVWTSMAAAFVGLHWIVRRKSGLA